MIRAVSAFYHTPAFPAGAGPEYVNAAAMIEAKWAPEDMLKVLHQIEGDFGRERVQRWGQRTLDLDLIAAGDAVLPDAQTHQYWMQLPQSEQQSQTPATIILPHPRCRIAPLCWCRLRTSRPTGFTP